jgi:microcystin-dependent protein
MSLFIREITTATRLADFSSGIGTAGATLAIDTDLRRVGIATTIPAGTLQVGTGITMYGSSGIVSATSINSNTINSETVRVGTAVTIDGTSGIVTATAFYGDGSNLTNTGSTLSSGIGTQRIVLTSQTSGTMTSSSTDSDLTFDSTTNTLNAPTFAGNGTIPIGGIIMWYGNIVDIPSGWSLCNGSNGTPDLRSRFVVGATDDGSTGVTFNADTGVVSGSYAPHNTGGKVAHQLTESEMPAHNHTIRNDNNNQNGSIPNGGDGSGASTTNNPAYISNTGGDNYHENRPPYYALAFIMRTT